MVRRRERLFCAGDECSAPRTVVLCRRRVFSAENGCSAPKTSVRRRERLFGTEDDDPSERKGAEDTSGGWDPAPSHLTPPNEPSRPAGSMSPCATSTNGSRRATQTVRVRNSLVSSRLVSSRLVFFNRRGVVEHDGGFVGVPNLKGKYCGKYDVGCDAPTYAARSRRDLVR